MKKVFIQERYGTLHRFFTIDTLDGFHKEAGCLVDAYYICHQIEEDAEFIFDVDKNMYLLMIEEFSLDASKYSHVSQHMTRDQIRIMDRERLTLCGYYKLYGEQCKTNILY